MRTFTIVTYSACARLRLTGFDAWRGIANAKMMMTAAHRIAANAIEDKRLTGAYSFPDVDGDGRVTIETSDEDEVQVQMAATILRDAAAKLGIEEIL